MLGGRFLATKVDQQTATPIQKTIQLSSLFHAKLAETPKKTFPESEQNLAEKESIC